MIERRRMMMEQGELPLGYKRCKYLESSGHQYIDTGIVENLRHRYMFSIEINDPYPIYRFIGCSKNGIIHQINTNENDLYYHHQYGGFLWRDTIIGKTKLEFKEDKDALFVNGEYACHIPADDRSTELTYWLFGRNPDTKSPCKFECFTLFSDNTNLSMLADYIPSIAPSGKPCMYDTITKQPFYNNGSGEFGYELMDGTYVAPV